MIRNLQKFVSIAFHQQRFSNIIISSPNIKNLYQPLYKCFSTQPTDSSNRQAQVQGKESKLSQSQAKKKERIKVVINDKDLEWSFVKGSGPGGQCVNKTSNNAILIHKPTGIQVRSHASRELEKNKQYCLKQLSEKLDVLVNGENSKKIQKENKKKKQDERRKRKSAEKYGNKKKEESQDQENEEIDDEEEGEDKQK